LTYLPATLYIALRVRRPKNCGRILKRARLWQAGDQKVPGSSPVKRAFILGDLKGDVSPSAGGQKGRNAKKYS